MLLFYFTNNTVYHRVTVECHCRLQYYPFTVWHCTPGVPYVVHGAVNMKYLRTNRDFVYFLFPNIHNPLARVRDIFYYTISHL